MSSRIARFFWREDINFLVTNRIPRRWATHFMGWFSRIESPLLCRAAISVWRLFAPDLDLREAEQQQFRSLRECFIRKLKPGTRPVDGDSRVLTSPCDAILGAHGRLDGVTAVQAKGYRYPLDDLLIDEDLVARHRDGLFVTLRLKSSMYHRFHAPCDAELSEVVYVSGDTWNVNPIALERVERLFCKNERAVLALETKDPDLALTLVPVAAILVAGIKLHCLPDVLDLRYRGPNRLRCSARFEKGDEMGYFQHGSTILLFASGPVELCHGLVSGQSIRMGQPLLRRTSPSASATTTQDPLADAHDTSRRTSAF